MSRIVIAFVATGLLLGVAGPITAAEPSTQSSSTSPALNPDILYDYDLFAASAEPRYGWFLVYRFGDGSTIESGPYASYYDAVYRLWFNAEHNVYPGAIDVDLVERRLPPAWQFVQRFDKVADAAAMAAAFQQFGLLTDIRRVSSIRGTTGMLQESTYR
jgi:hypothetical protein